MRAEDRFTDKSFSDVDIDVDINVDIGSTLV